MDYFIGCSAAPTAVANSAWCGTWNFTPYICSMMLNIALLCGSSVRLPIITKSFMPELAAARMVAEPIVCITAQIIPSAMSSCLAVVCAFPKSYGETTK